MRAPRLNLRFAALPLASLCWVSLCWAGSPSLAGLQERMVSVATSAQLSSNRAHVVARSLGNHAPMPLDLRPPEVMKTGTDDVLPTGANHHLFGTDKSAATLGLVSMSKPMSPAEAFARRVHQEGLPVARLWETRSALVSVGLNQRGKPGLWLIQKTH